MDGECSTHAVEKKPRYQILVEKTKPLCSQSLDCERSVKMAIDEQDCNM